VSASPTSCEWRRLRSITLSRTCGTVRACWSNMRPDKPEAAVIGAGLVGSLPSMFLARRGHRVTLYERRGDMRRESIAAGRSINLAISTRGLHALKLVGLEREVLKRATPMRGRMMHSPKGELTFQRYGRDD